MTLHLRATGRHLPYGITQCYLPPDTSERAPPNPRFTSSGGMEGWVSWLDSAPAGSRTGDLSITSPTPNGCTTKTTKKDTELVIILQLPCCLVLSLVMVHCLHSTITRFTTCRILWTKTVSLMLRLSVLWWYLLQLCWICMLDNYMNAVRNKKLNSVNEFAVCVPQSRPFEVPIA